MMRLLRVVTTLLMMLTTANSFAVHSITNSITNSNTNSITNAIRNTRSTAAQSSSSTILNGASLTLFSPCKINLFLRILRKRDDGFHDLASLFQAVGFGDTLHLEIIDQTDEAQEDEFTCNMPGVPVDQSNLVLRALTLMREKTGMPTFFKANLLKECPAQAGLGGGSANAATAMFAANELMGNPATLEEVSQRENLLDSCCTSSSIYIFIFMQLIVIVVFT